MDKQLKVFSRNYFSHIDLTIIVTLVLLTIFGVTLIASRTYVGGAVVFTLIVLVMIAYLRVPKKITVDINGFQYGKSTVEWKDVRRIVFTVSHGKDFRDNIIKVELSNDSHTIHPKFFINATELRNLFEEICKEKSIGFVVEDRGLN